MIGKRLPTPNNGSSKKSNNFKIEIPKDIISKVKGSNLKITSLKVKQGKENEKSSSVGNLNKPSNWREVGNFVDTLAQQQQQSNANENTSMVDDLILFNKNPLGVPLNYRICNHCGRPISNIYLEKHINDCLEIKKDKEAFIKKLRGSNLTQNVKIVIGDSANDCNNKEIKNETVYDKLIPVDSGAVSTGNKRKRKVDKEREKEEAKQLKELKRKQKLEEKKQNKLKKKEQEKEQKEKEKESKKLQKQIGKKSRSQSTNNGSAKTKRIQGPVDVEKQCGVPLAGGGFCARSLTCKTHSMGAKRAVQGRSASYDTLLAAYQRKNQVKLLAGAALAQAEKDDLAHGGAQYLDSDEETEQVMKSVRNSFAAPIVATLNHSIPVCSRNKYVRGREFYSSIFGSGRMSNTPLSGRVVIYKLDNTDEYVVRPRFSSASSVPSNSAAAAAIASRRVFQLQQLQQQYLAQKQMYLQKQQELAAAEQRHLVLQKNQPQQNSI